MMIRNAWMASVVDLPAKATLMLGNIGYLFYSTGQYMLKDLQSVRNEHYASVTGRIQTFIRNRHTLKRVQIVQKLSHNTQ